MELHRLIIDDVSTNQEIKENKFHDNFWKVESSSCNSNQNGVSEINSDVSTNQEIFKVMTPQQFKKSSRWITSQQIKKFSRWITDKASTNQKILKILLIALNKSRNPQDELLMKLQQIKKFSRRSRRWRSRR